LELARLLAVQIRRHPVAEYQPQELSNVVWALGTLGLLEVETVEHVLTGVRARLGGRLTDQSACTLLYCDAAWWLFSRCWC
jgi:hypothetical protein